MKKIVLFLVFLLYTFSCSDRDKQKMIKNESFTIKNKSIIVHDTLQYEIRNMSDATQFYLVLRMDKFSYQPAYNDKNFLGSATNRVVSHIYKGKDSLRVNEILTSTSPFFVYDEDEEEYNSYVDSLKQEIFRTTTSQKILKPNESVNIRTVFRNYEKDEITNDEYRMLLDNTENYTLQLSYTSDSTFVKQNISKELLDYLQKTTSKSFTAQFTATKYP